MKEIVRERKENTNNDRAKEKTDEGEERRAGVGTSRALFILTLITLILTLYSTIVQPTSIPLYQH